MLLWANVYNCWPERVEVSRRSEKLVNSGLVDKRLARQRSCSSRNSKTVLMGIEPESTAHLCAIRLCAIRRYQPEESYTQTHGGHASQRPSSNATKHRLVLCLTFRTLVRVRRVEGLGDRRMGDSMNVRRIFASPFFMSSGEVHMELLMIKAKLIWPKNEGILHKFVFLRQKFYWNKAQWGSTAPPSSLGGKPVTKMYILNHLLEIKRKIPITGHYIRQWCRICKLE